MKSETVYREIKTKTHAERILLRELESVKKILNNKDCPVNIEEREKLMKIGKEVEDALGLLLTYREYLKNPEDYKIK